MSDVFVSYKTEDRRRVKLLVEALQADGFSVWWDEQIGGGMSWRHAIEAELDAAKCVIVAWSKNSVGREGAFVQDEASRAQQRHVYVPVIFDKVALPLGFGGTQALPLSGWRGDRSDPRYQAVLTAARRNVGGDSALPSTGPKAEIDRRTVIAAGAVATAALGGAGAWFLLKPGSALSTGGIAVLPFANLSGDPSRAYFSDGIAEEIRTALARLPGVTVIGRTSSEAVRNDDARSAAKKLGVGHILNGSVRQSPSTIRITAELIDGGSGAEQWSQDYDRTPGDVIKIQTDIAQNVARALSAALGTVARAAITAGGTGNAEAQNLVLLAQGPAAKATKDSLEQARGLLDQAIQLDPNYADAYARNALVVSRLQGIYANNSAQMSDGLKDAIGLASHAVTLAPDFATAHWALASVYVIALQIPRGLLEQRRALELAPSDANVLRGYTNVMSLLARSQEAISTSKKVIAIDPLNPDSYNSHVEVLYNARLYSEAIDESDRIRRNSPELFRWPILLAQCLIGAARYDDARRMYAASEPDNPFRLAGEAVLAAKQGDKATTLARFARMKALYGDAENYQYAQINSQLNNTEQAIRDLQHAWAVRDPGLQFLRVDPWLDPLRRDPRFSALLKDMQFPT
jgi:serine/threonine-protein kinase